MSRLLLPLSFPPRSFPPMCFMLRRGCHESLMSVGQMHLPRSQRLDIGHSAIVVRYCMRTVREARLRERLQRKCLAPFYNPAAHFREGASDAAMRGIELDRPHWLAIEAGGPHSSNQYRRRQEPIGAHYPYITHLGRGAIAIIGYARSSEAMERHHRRSGSVLGQAGPLRRGGPGPDPASFASYSNTE